MQKTTRARIAAGGAVLAALATTLGTASIIRTARAQEPPLPAPPASVPFMPSAPAADGMTVMTATSDAVYILRGNTLYHYSRDLSLIKQVRLPAEGSSSGEATTPAAPTTTPAP